MSKEIERTLILLKPEAYERKLIGALISRFENKGFEIEAMKMIKASKKLMEDHYSDHKNKPFFEELVCGMCDKPIVGMVIKGPKTISTCRMLVGATNPLEAAPGTIRGDYGYEILPVLALAITVPSKITIL